MKKISAVILKTEELLAGAMLCMIAVLVFWSAVARTIGMPVNWAQDVSLLAFGWLTFIGSDIIIKSGGLIRIDMLSNRFPKAVQKTLMLVFDFFMLLFLLILIVYGFLLVSQSWNRTFNTLKMSYAWCTLAVPVGSLLMFFSMIGKVLGDIRKPMKEWGLISVKCGWIFLNSPVPWNAGGLCDSGVRIFLLPNEAGDSVDHSGAEIPVHHPVLYHACDSAVHFCR